MKNLKKKGFTIVELVIVIAVIAILSAVLIPTFSNLIRKAQVSADTQLAKNLNTALAIGEAEGKTIDDFSDVLDILHDEGYVISNLNPTADDNWFAWDKETNQIIYLNKDFEIVYSLEQPSDKVNWIIGVGTSDDRDTVRNAGIQAFFAPNNTEDLYSYISEILDVAQNEPQTIVISENINFDEQELIEISNVANLTFDLAGSTIGGTTIHDKAPVLVKSGNVIMKNGTLSAEGYFDSEGTTVKISSSLQLGEKIESDSVGLLQVENMTFDTYGTAIRVYNGTAVIKDSVINTNNGHPVYAGGGSDLTVKNITANVNNYSCLWASNYVTTDVYKPAKLTVESGTFNLKSDKTDHYMFSVHNDGEIIVKGGSFNLQGNAQMFSFSKGTMIITGGKFNGVDYLEYFEDGVTYGGGVASIDGTTVTITK